MKYYLQPMLVQNKPVSVVIRAENQDRANEALNASITEGSFSVSPMIELEFDDLGVSKVQFDCTCVKPSQS